MVRGSWRTGFIGSTLVRSLARLADVDVPESRQAFAERLGHWLDWTDAISLSSALNGNPMAGSSGAQADERDCMRVRSALTRAIAEDDKSAADEDRRHRHAPAREAPIDTTTDFSPHRQRYLARQQAMAASIGSLRGRLRTALAAGSPQMARLAAVDAVMEQVLSARERSLLSRVPVLLERHFERLRQATPADGPVPWLDGFRKEMQGLLLAELDLRWQPIEGLLEALRTTHGAVRPT